MANPQIENGFTAIANELLEAIYKVSLSDYEHRIFWLIVRKTYGYKKKLDWIAQRQIVDETGINKQNVSRTIKKLLAKKMITKEKKQIGIQKDYDNWVPIKSNLNRLPKSSKQITTVIPTDYKSNLNRGTQKKKETITKEIYIDILNYWNNKNIIITAMTEILKTQMRTALKKFKKDEIFLAVDNYSTALKDSSYFYDNHWSLLKFLKQGNGVPEWLADGSYWISYQNRTEKKKEHDDYFRA